MKKGGTLRRADMVSRMKLGCVAVVVPARPDVPLVAVKEVMVARGPNPTSSGIGRRGARGIAWSLKVMVVLYGSVAVLVRLEEALLVLFEPAAAGIEGPG